jgi:hypothetical protein
VTIARAAAVCLVTLATSTLTAHPAAAQEGHVTVPADQVHWAPAPPALPKGADIAVLEGDPGQKGTVTLRLKFPANYVIPPHWHTMTERVTVMSGALHVGMGDTLNRQASQTLEPGGYTSLPGRMHHFAWVAAPTVVQITLEGPFDIYYVNPSEDPQRTMTKR